MSSTTSVLFGITVGGTLYEWSSFRTLLPLILGAVGLLTFGIYEVFIPKEPMIPLTVFASRTAMSAYFGTFIHGMVAPSFSLLRKDSLEPQCVSGILVSICSHSKSAWSIGGYPSSYHLFNFQRGYRRISDYQTSSIQTHCISRMVVRYSRNGS